MGNVTGSRSPASDGAEPRSVVVPLLIGLFLLLVADSSKGGFGFVSDADWTPPLGWAAWVIVFALAAALYAAAGLRAAREVR